MLNFKNLDGFVIDLTTTELCDEILDDILCGDSAVYASVILCPLYRKREFIIDYFTSNYNYVFLKSPNVYQVVEETLYSSDEFESLKHEIEFLNYALHDFKDHNTLLTFELNIARQANTTMKEKLGSIYRVVKGDFEE